jgi:hypothetical protein
MAAGASQPGDEEIEYSLALLPTISDVPRASLKVRCMGGADLKYFLLAQPPLERDWRRARIPLGLSALSAKLPASIHPTRVIA